MIKLWFFITAILLVAQIIIVNHFAGSGAEVAQHKSQAQALQIRNQLLRQQLALLGSITQLTQLAPIYGLSPQTVAFIRPPSSLAGRP